ncbi:hypothetical protein [Natrialba asiatica]|uniref:Uncharacterized protein n=1 Tax=Natrialba asiatica (strain ATCC 700177 / DSM 12278 / JCM 9576 / FERM P-10747 / NBRC 102637 / 172P1) TaxID=29540 RepID=M0ALZ0_NATA1|nr:hypothetical protein [Natrialba asiatica]ELY98403.1 hypothetical protein C481_17277 [Natrialba asiatica DSM 12278]
MHRRHLLASAGIGLSIAGGCLQSSLPNTGGEDPSTAAAETTIQYDIQQLGVRQGSSLQFDGAVTGQLDVFDSSADVHRTLSFADHDGETPSSRAFVDETNFDTELLVRVTSVWPKRDFLGIRVRELDRTPGTFTGTATAIGDDPTEGDGALAFPAALVRVSVGEDHPESVEFTIVDYRENEKTVEEPISADA